MADTRVATKAPIEVNQFRYLLIVIGLLLFCGLVIMGSASSVASTRLYGSTWEMGMRQVIAIILGGLSGWWLSYWGFATIRKIVYLLYFITAGLLAYVYVAGVEVAGQRNWIALPYGLQFQPSELAKLSIILSCAVLWSVAISQRWSQRKMHAHMVSVSGVFIAGVLLQRDLGTPLILGAILLTMLYITGLSSRAVGILGLTGVIAVVGYSVLGPSYRLDRFRAWLSPEDSPMGYGYQILQGQFALALGGLTGQGPGSSAQKWGALPAAHTDFVLAIAGEEYGLVGSLFIILLISALVGLAFQIGSRSRDDFGRMVSYGIATWIAVQTFVNVGAIVRILPITGVPLPFVSYGPSSMLLTLIGIGMLLAVARKNMDDVLERQELDEVN